MYIYIYIYMYMFVYIYIYVYILRRRGGGFCARMERPGGAPRFVVIALTDVVAVRLPSRDCRNLRRGLIVAGGG